MKYNVGDRVRIKSLDWYNENKDKVGNILYKRDGSVYPVFFSKYMSNFCGEILTIKSVFNHSYHMNETSSCEFWTDEMIEGLVEEENTLSKNAKLVSERFSEYVNPSEVKYAQDTITKMLLQGANIPNEYILKDENGNVINATKIVLEKKKKEYPKTYEECCEILDIIDNRPPWHGYRSVQLKIFQKLLICRDAYWKIAGEEMGLGKPWEPQMGVIYCYMPNAPHYIRNIFPFPTEEMRDAFKENFDKDLEFCKELL